MLTMDMKNMYDSQCAQGQHRIGQKAVTHDGHTHPAGPQVCLNCDKTLDELFSEQHLAGEIAFARKVLAVSGGHNKLKGFTQAKRLELLTDKCKEIIPGFFGAEDSFV